MDYYNDNRRREDRNYIIGPYTQDRGPYPYVTNIEMETLQNMNFRTALWTGPYLQLTLMCIPIHGEIGLEIHPDTDQFIRIEQGSGIVMMGKHKEYMDFKQNIAEDDVIFIPAGMWHNLVNTGWCPLKLYTIYAPPHHPHGTVHRTKTEADMMEH